MGVAGLWDILRPAGEQRSLTHLALVDGFQANPRGKRGFRVGIDASIWFYHAQYGREGENPELRTLFFRCARLMSMAFLPLFIFDGPKRPSVKRGKRIGGGRNSLEDGMRNIIKAMSVIYGHMSETSRSGDGSHCPRFLHLPSTMALCTRFAHMPLTIALYGYGVETLATHLNDTILAFEVSVELSNSRMSSFPRLKADRIACRGLETSPDLWLTHDLLQAPGEAEAELAYLNRVGIIDAVLSDDVDTLIFGGCVVVRNPGTALSGNRGHPLKNADGKEDKNHAMVYKASTIASHPSIQLSRPGLILIGLLSGGDYDQGGLSRCGPTIAHGLARCGFGDTLYNAASALPRDKLQQFLVNWRHELRHELRTNSRGIIGRKHLKLADSFPEDFPNIDILLSYTDPITSETEGWGKVVEEKQYWAREPDLGAIASLCEKYFEWGVKETIVKRFRTVIWPGAILRILRRAVLDIDERKGRLHQGAAHDPATPRKKKDGTASTTSYVGTPTKMVTRHFSSLQIDSPFYPASDDEDDEPLIFCIHSSRTHASTDGLLEYRLEIAPTHLVTLTEAGVMGSRKPIESLIADDEDWYEDKATKNKPPPEPSSHLRLWMPASMVQMAEPGLVQEFEDGVRKKKEKKEAKGKGKGKKAVKAVFSAGDDVERASSCSPNPVSRKTKKPDPVASGKERNTTRKQMSRTEEEIGELAPQKDLKDFFGTTKKVGPSRLQAKPGTSKNHVVPGSSKSSTVVQLKEKPKPKSKPVFMDLSDSDSGPVQVSRTAVSAPLGTGQVQPARKGGSTDASRLGMASKKPKPVCTDEAPILMQNALTGTSRQSVNISRTTSQRSGSGSTVIVPKAPTQPRPFPMSFSNDELRETHITEDDPFVLTATESRRLFQSVSTPLPKRPRGKSPKNNYSSNSESEALTATLKKSPRKSKKHISPRTKSVLSVGTRPQDEDGESEAEQMRPGSPSPFKTRPKPSTTLAKSVKVPGKATTKSGKMSAIIEISSDSDVPSARLVPAKSTVAPLLLAKGKAEGKAKHGGGVTTNAVKVPKKAAILSAANTNVGNCDRDDGIIDLT